MGTCSQGTGISGVVTLTDTGSSAVMTATQTGNISGLILSGFRSGITYNIAITQGNSGGYTLAGAAHVIGLPTWVTDSGTTNSLTCYYDGTNCTVIAANNNSGHFAYPAGVCPTNAPSSGIFGCVQPVTLMPNYINPSTTFSGGSPTQGVGTPYLTIAPPGPDHKVVQYGDAVGNLVRVQLASGDLSDNANVSLLSASQTIAGDKTFTGKLDASNGTHTLPARTGLAGSKPAICTVGEIYFGSDATAGQNLYLARRPIHGRNS